MTIIRYRNQSDYRLMFIIFRQNNYKFFQMCLHEILIFFCGNVKKKKMYPGKQKFYRYTTCM